MYDPILAAKATMWGRQNAPHLAQPRRGCTPTRKANNTSIEAISQINAT